MSEEIYNPLYTAQCIARAQLRGRIEDGNALLAQYHAMMLAHIVFLKYPLLRPCRYCDDFCENDCVLKGWIPKL